MSNPTDQPLTTPLTASRIIGDICNRRRNSDIRADDLEVRFALDKALDAQRAALVLLQSQFDNLRRDKEEGDRQNALILADYRKEAAAHAATRERNAELREALKDKQRGMTFTESERNAELVRQVTETRKQLQRLRHPTEPRNE